MRAGIRRDETTQAIGVARQFAAIDAAGVHGAFCFTFLEPAYTWIDANTDLDAASFGITRLDRAPHGHRERGDLNAHSPHSLTCTPTRHAAATTRDAVRTCNDTVVGHGREAHRVPTRKVTHRR